MALTLAHHGVRPTLPTFCAPNATLVGDVRCAPGSSVWFGAVLRGDINFIALGADSNVQDLCCLHVSPTMPCRIGERTTMGHGAIAHACTLGDECLLGMHSTVLDGAVIGDGCVIAAGAVVPEGMAVPPGHLVAGVPGKVIKPLSATIKERLARINNDYQRHAQEYRELVAAAEREALD
jgi:carbonic anhydrase/acetyltransferase-like protein (isoleucine patch superfamily)